MAPWPRHEGSRVGEGRSRQEILSLASGTIEHTFDRSGWYEEFTPEKFLLEELDGADSPAGIPAGLDAMEPGPVLAALLSTIDVGELSGRDRVSVLRAHQRLASHFAAQVYADMAAVVEVFSNGDDDDPLTVEEAATEVRVALRLTRRAADAEVGLALELRERLPAVWEALAAGVIDPRRAKTIAAGVAHLPEATARQVVAAVMGEAAGLTTGQLAARLRRLCVEADPDEAQRRYEQAVAERRVVMEPSTAGTAHFGGFDLAPHRVSAASRRINQLARSLKTNGETRTLDQLRADVFLDLLCGNGDGDGSGSGSVEIRVDLATLAELSEAPGELAGYGPVVADLARQVTALQRATSWRFTVTDPDSGEPAASGVTRRRPDGATRRWVEARDTTCVFPGCRMPATACDLDHRILWSEGGATTVDQLAPLCRHDHVIRHRAGWSHEPLPNGDHTWTSPLGHIYTTSGKPP